jgi:hypothetical protein
LITKIKKCKVITIIIYENKRQFEFYKNNIILTTNKIKQWLIFFLKKIKKYNLLLEKEKVFSIFIMSENSIKNQLLNIQ